MSGAEPGQDGVADRDRLLLAVVVDLPLPRDDEEESSSAKKGDASVLLLRSADDYLDALLNPGKQNKLSPDTVPFP